MNSVRPLLLTLLSVCGLCWRADAFTRVAYDDAGADDTLQPHLTAADGPWRFNNPGTSDERLRTAVFGRRIEFVYQELNPQAAYKARLRFFSDNKRELLVKTGSGDLLASIELSKEQTSEHEVLIPKAAYATGRLALVFERVSGSNAVISDIEIISDDPRPLTAAPWPESPVASIVPRLSPRPSAVAGTQTLDVELEGTWQFNPQPATNYWLDGDLDSVESRGWVPIQVPGQWVMQGLHVEANAAAGYRRTFAVPGDWARKRVKLRCDGVYSDATVWINGKMAGHHEGGFTPFEFDVTELVNTVGDNRIDLTVVNESLADTLASGTKYACHPLGGISRKIRLFALPAVNVAALYVTTVFDGEFRDATLGVTLCSVNEGQTTREQVRAVIHLVDPEGRVVPLADNQIIIGSLGAGQTMTNRAAFAVQSPLKWDNERPHLYTLRINLEAHGEPLESLSQKVGFRQVEIRGNKMYVNNLPVKLRGVNRHEVYPVTGRSVPEGLHRREVELFREANVNLLRTSHYPPDEALLDAADELGMFIECEAPFCWTSVPIRCLPQNKRHRYLILRQTAEMVMAYRNHPSVLFWSLSNESRWGDHYAAASELVRELDHSRPQTFNNPGDPKYTEIVNFHYCGHGGPAKGRGKPDNPIYLGEDCHLNAYNRLELATDPALRDIWGRYLCEMWDAIYASEGCLGQSIWAGIDDTFYLDDNLTVGYGTWGLIDGWHRLKPEYWNTKKAYSPVRILNKDSLTVSNNMIEVQIQNRQNFADLREMRIFWRTGKEFGELKPRLAPGMSGNFPITLADAASPGSHLELTFEDPRGFLADRFRLALPSHPAAVDAVAEASGQYECLAKETDREITVSSAGWTWRVSKRTGSLSAVDMNGQKIPLSGPQLMLLPMNDTGENQMHGETKVWNPFTEVCGGWSCGNARITQTDGRVEVNVTGSYQEAEGAYKMVFRSNGELELSYFFTLTTNVNPRQIGVVFSLPRTYERLTWERVGYWDVYPEDHIARLQGTVMASEGYAATSVGPRKKPNHPWRLDQLPYGNNDFCSTKHNVVYATLTDQKGLGVKIHGRGEQHVRCWQDGAGVHLLVADYSNGGSEKFLKDFVKNEVRFLQAGAKVEGLVRLSPQDGR